MKSQPEKTKRFENHVRSNWIRFRFQKYICTIYSNKIHRSFIRLLLCLIHHTFGLKHLCKTRSSRTFSSIVSSLYLFCYNPHDSLPLMIRFSIHHLTNRSSSNISELQLQNQPASQPPFQSNKTKNANYIAFNSHTTNVLFNIVVIISKSNNREIILMRLQSRRRTEKWEIEDNVLQAKYKSLVVIFCAESNSNSYRIESANGLMNK